MAPPPARPAKRKSPAAASVNGTKSTNPATPQKRRKGAAAGTAQDSAPPPPTPTPSAVGLMAEPSGKTTSVSESDAVPVPASPTTPRPRRVARSANPALTNATLLSPETSKTISPTKMAVDDETTTSVNLLQKACEHLVRVDARMAPLIAKHHCRLFSPEGLAEEIDPFEALASGIISQQVSGAAAKSIKARFVALFDNDNDAATAGETTGRGTGAKTPGFPRPSQVAAFPLDTLRTAGLSQRKAEYISGLAAKFVAGELTAEMLANDPYEEIVEKLTAVRGLGRWSVEMFACFALKRMDVFSLGDLGVQRGMAAFVGRDVSKLKAKGGKWKYMSEPEMKEISDRFAPYRSLFMWYMWRVEETDVSTMESAN